MIRWISSCVTGGVRLIEYHKTNEPNQKLYGQHGKDRRHKWVENDDQATDSVAFLLKSPYNNDADTPSVAPVSKRPPYEFVTRRLFTQSPTADLIKHTA